MKFTLKLKPIKPYFFFLMTMVWLQTYGQYNIENFKKYTIADGLTNNNVLSIGQDHLGYIWLGTLSGLNRYDGGNFENINELIPHKKHSVEFTNIKTFGNTVGICTESGAYLLNPNNLSLKHIKLPSSLSLDYYKNVILNMEYTKKGNLALSTKTGFYVLNKNNNIVYAKDHFTDEDIGKKWILYGQKIIRDEKGRILQMSSTGYNIYNDDDNSFAENPDLSFIDFDVKKESNVRFFNVNDYIITLSYLNKKLSFKNCKTRKITPTRISEEVSKNIFWNSTLLHLSEGKYIMNGITGLQPIYLDEKNNSILFDSTIQLPSINAHTIFLDKYKKLWIGTTNGLYKEESKKPINEYFFDGEINNSICAFHIDKSEIVIAFKNCQLYKLDPTDKSTKLKISLKNRGFNIINDISKIGGDKYLIATDKGLFEFSYTNLKTSKINLKQCIDSINNDLGIYRISKNKKGKTILITSNYKIQLEYDATNNCYKYFMGNLKNDRPDISAVSGFSDDNIGNYWFYGDGIYRYNSSINKIDSLIVSTTLNNKFYRVFFIDFNSKNDAFIRLLGDNWLIQKHNGHKFILADTELIPLGISPMNIIDDYMYYVTSQSKLAMLNTLTFDYKLFSTSEKFINTSLTTTIFKKFDNKIYFCSNQSLMELDLDLISKDDSQLRFSQVKIGDIFLNDINNQITLPYEHNTFSLKFNLIDFHHYANNKLSYRINPVPESKWMKLNGNEINFNNLPTATYELEIKKEAYNKFYPLKISKFKITIIPPWYQTWWFYMLCSLASLYFISLFVKRRIAKANAISNIEKKLSQAEMKALQSQMNPHFVFNCLNSIKLLVIQNETQRAASYLNKFSSLMRSILDESQKSTIEIRSVVKHLTEYIELEKLRSKDLHYSITVDKNINQDYQTIPSMLIQPIVENAIWHGKNIEEDKSVVHIHFSENEKFIYCKIEDFGVGYQENKISEKQHNSIGLLNIKKRIELLNEQGMQQNNIEIINKKSIQKGTGTIVTLSFEKSTLL